MNRKVKGGRHPIRPGKNGAPEKALYEGRKLKITHGIEEGFSEPED